jgi:hypothetical protein
MQSRGKQDTTISTNSASSTAHLQLQHELTSCVTLGVTGAGVTLSLAAAVALHLTCCRSLLALAVDRIIAVFAFGWARGFCASTPTSLVGYAEHLPLASDWVAENAHRPIG